MPLWIPITIAGAFLQNLRSVLQKHLRGRVSATGATYVRFIYALPFAIAYLLVMAEVRGEPLPVPGALTLVYVLLGAVSQMSATYFLLRAFDHGNFAIGTTYSKTETVQVALLGLALLGDVPGWLALLGITVSLAGMVVMACGKGQTSLVAIAGALRDKAALFGIVSGTIFAVSAVSYRAAALSLGDGDFLLRAATTLVVATSLQTVLMGVWLVVKAPGEFSRVLGAWRVGLFAGAAGMAASTCWFTAFTLQNAAYVRALGQIELVFTFMASVLFFHERPAVLEVLGVALVSGGIILILLQ